MQRRLEDMHSDQAAARRANMFAGWDVGEVNHLCDLVRGMFGYDGVVEASESDPGMLSAGYFVDPPVKGPGIERRRVLPFKGRTLAEFEKQFAAAKANL